MQTSIYKFKPFVFSITMFLLSYVLLGLSQIACAAEANCPAWVNNKPYPANECVTYNSKQYQTQWWADAGVAPFIGANSWDSPWVLVGDAEPPLPVVMPGVPVLQSIPTSTNGQVNVSWSTDGNGGTYWKLLKDSNELRRYTQFTDTTNKSATATNIRVDNGTFNFTVQLCNADNTCETSNAQTVIVSGAPEKTGIFMAYYPTWFAPFHDAFCPGGVADCKPTANAPVIPDADITKSSLLAGGIPDYITHVMLAFGKFNAMHNYHGLTRAPQDLQVLGLDLTPSSASFKESIRVLKNNNPGTKVILALGGATYNDSWDNVTAADITKLTQVIVDLGLDGVDVDYEVGGVDEQNITKYYNAIVNIRKAVDEANAQTGKHAIVTLAGWSTGADCTAQTHGAQYPDCAGKTSYFGGNAGRERLVLQGKGAASMIDAYGIMSYDSGYTHFDPVVAYRQYRALATRPGAIVAIGIQPSPDEGWGQTVTLVDDKGVDNPCKGEAAGADPSANSAGGNAPGNTILWDQYGNPKPGTFSVQRFQNAVSANPGDGFMLWSLFALRTPATCGGISISSVTELARGVSEYMNLGSDRIKQIDKQAADNYNK